MKKTVMMLVAALMFAVGSAQAQVVIAGWDFDPLTGGAGNYGPSPLAASTTVADVTIGGLTRGSGMGTTSGTGAGNAWGGNDFTGTSLATATTLNEFATFTVKANSGYELSLSSISAYNIRRSASGPTTGQWQFSLDGSSFTDIGSSITWGATTSASGNAQSSISLTGITSLQSVSDTTTITFRVVTWGASGTTGTWYLNDPSGTPGVDFALNGTVVAAIPEPSTYALVGLGLGALWFLRRRKAAVVRP